MLTTNTINPCLDTHEQPPSCFPHVYRSLALSAHFEDGEDIPTNLSATISLIELYNPDRSNGYTHLYKCNEEQAKECQNYLKKVYNVTSELVITKRKGEYEAYTDIELSINSNRLSLSAQERNFFLQLKIDSIEMNAKSLQILIQSHVLAKEKYPAIFEFVCFAAHSSLWMKHNNFKEKYQNMIDRRDVSTIRELAEMAPKVIAILNHEKDDKLLRTENAHGKAMWARAFDIFIEEVEMLKECFNKRLKNIEPSESESAPKENFPSISLKSTQNNTSLFSSRGTNQSMAGNIGALQSNHNKRDGYALIRCLKRVFGHG